MALTKITTSVVAVNSLTAANIADNSIDATKIANNQILARHIAAGALTDQLGTLPSATISGNLTVDTTTLVVDSSNNRVGIGTTSPAQALSIEAADTTVRFMEVKNSAGSMLVGVNGSGNSFVSGQTSGKSLSLETNNTERMSIASDGKIDMYPSGAETTGGLRVVYNGDNNYEIARFQSEGNYDAHVSFVTNGSTQYYWSAGIDYSDGGKFKIANDNLVSTNTELTITRSGEVGILTDNPQALLEIDPPAVDTAIFAIRRQDHASIPLFKFFQDSSVSQGTGHAHMNTGNRDLSITADTSATKTLGLYLKTTGAVGIGTVTPGANKLSIRNSTYSSGNRMLIVSNGSEDVGASYDTIVVNQSDVPTIRLIETQTDVQMALSCGNENSNSAVLGTTGKLVFTTGNSADFSGYSVANKRFEITDSNNYSWNTLFVRSTNDQILSLDQNDTGGWNYIGFLSQNARKWYAGMDSGSDFIIGSDVANKTVNIENANLNAPGVIVQTQVARGDNAVGTGDFDVISLTITPKFADSDMLVHFYTQWSVITNDGEDWGLKLQRDGTTILGDGVCGYFISGGGVDAADWIGQGSTTYGVNFASKTDIDTARSSSTSTITYKIRKVVQAGTSTKTVRFGVDGWTGASAESQRSKFVLMVQEIRPN